MAPDNNKKVEINVVATTQGFDAVNKKVTSMSRNISSGIARLSGQAKDYSRLFKVYDGRMFDASRASNMLANNILADTRKVQSALSDKGSGMMFSMDTNAGRDKAQVQQYRELADAIAQRYNGTARLVSVTDRLSVSSRKLGKQINKVKMEYLGLMFFGMALERTMFGLMSTSLEWAGVSKVLSAALGMMFLPVALQLLDWALAFMDWVSDPKNEKLIGIIGQFVLWAGILGIVLSYLGQLKIGFDAVSAVIKPFFMLFGKSNITGLTAFGTLAQALGISLTALTVIIAAIIVVLVGMFLAWKENFLGMRDVVDRFIQGFKTMFSGLLDFFKGIWNIIKALFTGDADLLVEGIKQAFVGLFNFVKGAWQTVVALAEGIVIGTLRVLVGMFQTIFNFIGKIPQLWGGNKMWDVDWLGDLSSPEVTKVNDFILKDGKMYKPNPNDTITGIKNGNGAVGGNTTFAPVINVNASINSEMDVRKLADDLKKYWVADFERTVSRRGL